MTTKIDEIAPDIYRLSTLVPEIGPTGFTFNQFLVVDDEPLLFHTGHRSMLSGVADQIARVTPLDGLRWIRVHRDPSLAIRFSCINANACKECMIRVDGKTVYACTTRLAQGEMTLEPLPNKKLIKDLVTEIAPPDERLN